jgi:hypothetical protein
VEAGDETATGSVNLFNGSFGGSEALCAQERRARVGASQSEAGRWRRGTDQAAAMTVWASGASVVPTFAPATVAR